MSQYEWIKGTKGGLYRLNASGGRVYQKKKKRGGDIDADLDQYTADGLAMVKSGASSAAKLATDLIREYGVQGAIAAWNALFVKASGMDPVMFQEMKAVTGGRVGGRLIGGKKGVRHLGLKR